MKRDQRIETIISRFNEADNEHIAQMVEQAYDTRKQTAVEVVIANTLQGYFDGSHIAAAIASDDIQIRLETLMRDIAVQAAQRQYGEEMEEMTSEQAQKDAAAGYRTGQQQDRIERCSYN
ncbi:MAG: hypothetical protein [Bacteriophage sp.]|nr:MAG: hypothetical protein [Bacteriophage sp.]